MQRRRDFVTGAVALAATTGIPRVACAQSDTVRIIVGFPAGAGADAIARKLADKLRLSMGKTVIVENVAGAAGRIAATQVKNAAPDGRTMLLSPSTSITILPLLYKNLAYDPVKDLAPVTAISNVPLGFVVGPAAKGKTLAEYVQWAKADPARATFASPGAGSGAHFLGVMFAKAAGLDLAHVPYKGAAPAQQDLIGGQVPAYAGIIGRLVLSEHRAGRIRVLAVSQPHRSPYLPDVPTFAEAGYPAVQAAEWTGLFLPARTPPKIVEDLNRQVVAALQAEDVQSMLSEGAQESIGNSVAAFKAQIASEMLAWAPVIRTSGFKPEE